VRQLFQEFEQIVQLGVVVLNDNLERTEQLFGEQVSLLLSSKVLYRHLDGSGLVGTVHLGNRVVLERHASKQQLCAVQLKDLFDVLFELVVVPR